jgi:hypothetical protein
MTPWTEDRLLARTAGHDEWWTLEQLHETHRPAPAAVPDCAAPGQAQPPEQHPSST